MEENNIAKTFSELYPPHPHRRLHILLAILGLIMAIGAILVFNNNYNVTIENTIPTEEERISAFNKELVRLSDAMTETGMGQKELSSEELKSIADNLKKK